jgi:hypothetical protein
MTVRLPEELRTVVTAMPGVTVELLDEQTHRSYVLLSLEEFQRLKDQRLKGAEYELSDTYVAQLESAMQAGWNDPMMDEYDDYDLHRGQP